MLPFCKRSSAALSSHSSCIAYAGLCVISAIQAHARSRSGKTIALDLGEGSLSHGRLESCGTKGVRAKR